MSDTPRSKPEPAAPTSKPRKTPPPVPQQPRAATAPADAAAPLEYARAPVPVSGNEPVRNLAAPKPVKLADYKSDPGPFELISSQLMMSGSTWHAVTCISPRAIYILLGGISEGHRSTMISPGSALAELILNNAMKTHDAPTILRSCLVADLPEGVQQIAFRRSIGENQDAIVVARERVFKIGLKPFSDVVRIYSGGVIFHAVIGLFSSGGVRKKLEQAGYAINVENPAADEDVPTFAVVQEGKKRSWLIRLSLVIAAVVLFIIIVIIGTAMQGNVSRY